MSPVDFILGIRDVVIERVERGREIHVWARPAKRQACIHCQQASVRIKATHPRTLKHTRQGNQLMVLQPKPKSDTIVNLQHPLRKLFYFN